MEKKKTVNSKQYEKPSILATDNSKVKITLGNPSGFKYCGNRKTNKADSVQKAKEK